MRITLHAFKPYTLAKTKLCVFWLGQLEFALDGFMNSSNSSFIRLQSLVLYMFNENAVTSIDAHATDFDTI